MNPKLKLRLKLYQAFHQSNGNTVCHETGIPLIVLAILGFLSRVEVFPLFGLDVALILLFLVGLWVFWLDWKIAFPYLLTLLGIYLAGRSLENLWLLWAFGLGWVLQLIGHHVFEKNRPAFLTNIEHLFVGPLWLFSKLTGYLELETASK